jgi:hypothetical protein
MIFFEHAVVGDEARYPVEQETDLFVFLEGAVGGGHGAVEFLVGDHAADQIDGRVVLISVFSWPGGDYIFFKSSIGLREEDGHGLVREAANGEGYRVVAKGAENEVAGVDVNLDAELAFGVGDDAMPGVLYRNGDV